MTRNIGDFGMFTTIGNNAVEKLINEANELALDHTKNKYDIIALLRKGMKQIAADGHGEVYDTVVREEIIFAVGCSGTNIFDISENRG